ncbi:membrane-spanning 4-domains subfamily A member 4D-like [Kryptolebias marmoratus]|uniref:Membrane-spanning 4-domains subfamily A member 4D-like n=1 Tax=Kryptolebias marmoratus TaxID=37003 RepID=A0A3Q3ACJ6_KRYMA|nr:membrane-spanning 4-domains subfamily A member 4D-like [Kryptolebias marmoratus]
MEGTESVTRQRAAGRDGNQQTENTLMSGKPLHRFVKNEPRCLGIVILIFGYAELFMGFVLPEDYMYNSRRLYIPFWQGALFLTCGILSIYTELHPSKKLVTVCVSMYSVSLVGILVSFGHRITFFGRYGPMRYYRDSSPETEVLCLEIILFISSVCVFGLLIFLIVSARFALKSTHTQVIVQYIPQLPQNEMSH